jgi:diketogulonate reductase-like aldo/keto reductase
MGTLESMLGQRLHDSRNGASPRHPWAPESGVKGQAGKAAAFSPERTGQLKPRGAARICGGNALAAAPKPRAPHERLLANRDPAHKMQHMDAATGAPALVTLPSGHEMPSLGLGTWRMGESRASHANELAAVHEALDIGYRAFDTAEMYAEGGAETLLGEALATALRGGLSREQLFVVSKVYPQNASERGVVAACERSLRRLRLEHIDLYLLHWRGAVPLRDTVAGFERLQQRGLIGHWGVSNFDLDDMLELCEVAGGGACSANQVWYSLTQRGVEFDLLPWQRARQMPLMAYSPVDQGTLLSHAGLREMASRRGVAPAQLALAWVLAQPGVMAIPKSADGTHLRQNWQAATLRLQPDEAAQLDALFAPPRAKRPLAVG